LIGGATVRLPMKEVTSYCVPCESNRCVRADTSTSESSDSDTGSDNVLLCSIADAGIRGGIRSKGTLLTLMLCGLMRKGFVVRMELGICPSSLMSSGSGVLAHGGVGKLLKEKSLRVPDGLEEDGEFGRPTEPSSNFKAAILLSSSSCLRKRPENLGQLYLMDQKIKPLLDIQACHI